MPAPPQVHELGAADTETSSNLSGSDEMVDVDTSSHRRDGMKDFPSERVC